MSQDIGAEVRERVRRIRRHPGAGEVFGVRGHGFRLGDVLEEGQVRELEGELGCRLPEAYRSFLLRVGRGGAGPDHGLMTPVREEDGWRWRGAGLGYPGQPTSAEFAGRPFVAEAVQRDIDALDAAEPREDAFEDDDAFREAFAAWDAQYEELYDAQEAGTVFLSEQGCGYTSLLVMTGPHRGEVWEDLRPADCGIVPTGLDFGAWYLKWLARTEQQLGLAPAAS
ncbi:SMI1/KNR4 family protein [Streptomyces sp. VRA16 Mangrove soil]|uniref:SMI1/KNR4 family protein n=1 Tax=Streptomyces sp. VRA16 Mangrove soil TaxID=2817434 RepID=UPI001A9FE936|nr:SMI1/KNR4 family protein [Streptomyces sp. VRA16 Mangrove soil]MBO1337941.1 SMI1/KNR4 family protein [Streptomyces sp. VRA16 Mangrove soil]